MEFIMKVLAVRRNPDCLANEVHRFEGPSRFPEFDLLLLKEDEIVPVTVGLELDGRDADGPFIWSIKMEDDRNLALQEEIWDQNVEIHEAIYGSKAYSDAVKAYSGVEITVPPTTPEFAEGVIFTANDVYSVWNDGENEHQLKAEVSMTPEWGFKVIVTKMDGSEVTDPLEREIECKWNGKLFEGETAFADYIGTKMPFNKIFPA